MKTKCVLDYPFTPKQIKASGVCWSLKKIQDFCEKKGYTTFREIIQSKKIDYRDFTWMMICEIFPEYIITAINKELIETTLSIEHWIDRKSKSLRGLNAFTSLKVKGPYNIEYSQKRRAFIYNYLSQWYYEV